MNTKHYTSIEMSKKLLELGLNTDTADMCYIQHFREYSDEVTCIEEIPIVSSADAIDIPCWSLGALIRLMPSMIYKGKDTFSLEMHKDALYHVCYENRRHLNEIWVTKKNLLDAAFEMVCWLLENNYIKKGE